MAYFFAKHDFCDTIPSMYSKELSDFTIFNVLKAKTNNF